MIDYLIKDLKLVHVPLSTGAPTLGVMTELGCGIAEWDASPLGTTVASSDPVNLDAASAETAFVRLKAGLIGTSVLNQPEIDETITEAMGQDAHGVHGVNLAIATSCSVARAAAAYQHVPLFQYLSTIFGREPKMPGIMCNVLGGGGHHANSMKITELMVTMRNLTPQAVNSVIFVRRNLGEILEQDGRRIEVGLEGSLVTPDLPDFEAIGKLVEVLRNTGMDQYMRLGLDMAGVDAIDLVRDLVETFEEIDYVEDPFPINQTHLFRQLLSENPKLYVAGDDLIAGRLETMEWLLDAKYVNSIVIKLNHLGTITRVFHAAETAQARASQVVLSQRSQETGKDTLSHIAVAAGADYIKAGSPVRERISNYSNLLVLLRLVQS
jgi:enolase